MHSLSESALLVDTAQHEPQSPWSNTGPTQPCPAAREAKDRIDLSDFEKATDRVIGGLESPKIMSPEEKRTIAYHEAGHTVVQALLDHADPLHKVTIIPRGKAGGATFSLPEKDRTGFGRRYLDATLKVLCGGG